MPCFSFGHFQRIVWASDNRLGQREAAVWSTHLPRVISQSLLRFWIPPIFQHLSPWTSDISQTPQQASFPLLLGAPFWHVCLWGVACLCWGSTVCLLLTVICHRLPVASVLPGWLGSRTEDGAQDLGYRVPLGFPAFGSAPHSDLPLQDPSLQLLRGFRDGYTRKEPCYQLILTARSVKL